MALKDPSHDTPTPQEQGCAECWAQPAEPCRPNCTAQASRIDQAEDTATLASRQATGLELRERLAKITSQTRATTPEYDRHHQDRTMDNQPEIGT